MVTYSGMGVEALVRLALTTVSTNAASSAEPSSNMYMPVLPHQLLQWTWPVIVSFVVYLCHTPRSVWMVTVPL